VSRRQQDLDDARDWFGMNDAAARAYADRVEAYDANSLRLVAAASGVPLLQRLLDLEERLAHLEAVIDQPGVVDFLDGIARGGEGVVQ
jgi:hypothetical protein